MATPIRRSDSRDVDYLANIIRKLKQKRGSKNHTKKSVLSLDLSKNNIISNIFDKG